SDRERASRAQRAAVPAGGTFPRRGAEFRVPSSLCAETGAQWRTPPGRPGGPETTMLTLYHWEPNANSGKPMLALAEKGVPYQSHYLDLLSFDQHSAQYLQINPEGTIPALVHGERVLTESTPMMEYIDAEFDGPALR